MLFTVDELQLERRRRQNLTSPRPDARGVAPSVRSFPLAIDRQRQGLERIPLLEAARPGLAQLCAALAAAEVAAIALSLDDAAQELPGFAEAARESAVPILRADLLLEEFQIYESRAAGADAVLLHAAALPEAQLARLSRAAQSTHMAVCLACASPAELELCRRLQPQVVVVPPALASAALPARTLVLALSYDAALRGRADAALDPDLGRAQDPAGVFRAALQEES